MRRRPFPSRPICCTMRKMKTVTSKDGSRIAYDRHGSGPAVILVAGALGYRKFKQTEQLARLLAEHCTVINYDRRGRGDSTEVKPFAVEREIEDIQALIDAVGGSASLWGWSSGGALALRAAGAAVEEAQGDGTHPPVRLGGARRAHDVRRAAEPRRVGRGDDADAGDLRR